MKENNLNEKQKEIQTEDNQDLVGKNDKDVNQDVYYELYEDDRL